MHDLLYHYINQDGLLGILRTKVLWASNAEFLNDALELDYGRAAALREVEQLLDLRRPCQGDEHSHGHEMQIRLLERAVAELSAPPGSRSWRIYVACFCEDGDLLSQWRAYGDDGGYALAFDAAALTTIKCGPRPATLTQVRYGADTAKPEIDAAVIRLTELIAQNEEAARSHFLVELLPLIATTKHPTFREEQERRLMVMDHLQQLSPACRGTRFAVVPYVELPIPSGALREIVVGPGRYPELRMNGVQQLLDVVGLADVRVRTSGSPLRL